MQLRLMIAVWCCLSNAVVVAQSESAAPATFEVAECVEVAPQFQFHNPFGGAFDTKGNLLVVEYLGGRVLRVANGTVEVEPTMDVEHVARSVVYMASLPLEANVLTMTVMATKMPFVGRG